MSHKIKKFAIKFDDLGVIIMGNRCSIQQGEENNCWLEQSHEKSTVSTVPLFLGHPVYDHENNERVRPPCGLLTDALEDCFDFQGEHPSLTCRRSSRSELRIWKESYNWFKPVYFDHLLFNKNQSSASKVTFEHHVIMFRSYSAYHIRMASLCARCIIPPALAPMQPFSAKSIRRNKFLPGTNLLRLGRERDNNCGQNTLSRDVRTDWDSNPRPSD